MGVAPTGNTNWRLGVGNIHHVADGRVVEHRISSTSWTSMRQLGLQRPDQDWELIPARTNGRDKSTHPETGDLTQGEWSRHSDLSTEDCIMVSASGVFADVLRCR